MSAILSAFFVALLIFGAVDLRSQGNRETQTSQSAKYEVLTKGLVASRPFAVQFKSAPLRLEIRNLVMGRGDARDVPTPTTILMELRGGTVTTGVKGEMRERHQGEFWTVEKESSLTIRNPGEVAVIRAIYIFEGKHN